MGFVHKQYMCYIMAQSKQWLPELDTPGLLFLIV